MSPAGGTGQPVRVGIVGPCPPPHGGVTRIIGNHLKFWESERIRAWVIPLTVPQVSEGYPNCELVDRNAGTAGALSRLGAALRIGPRLAPMGWGGLRNTLGFASFLGESIRRLELDVIYAHHATLSGMVAVTEARRAGIPSVVVAYGETWLAQDDHRSWRRAIHYSVKQADWIVSTSEHCLKGALTRGADPARSSVIYAGIDLERFRPGLDGGEFRARHAIPAEAVVISMLGLALRSKLDTFLDALNLLLEDPAVHVLIGGAGADTKYLIERVRGVASGRVKALGFVPEPELPGFYSATDILVVSPRTVVECMGQSMKEAMSCGRAVVGARLGGVPEAIEDGRSGLMFEPDNPQDLGRVLRQLASNRELQRSMGARGRIIAEKKFQARTSAAQTFELLQRLASRAAR